MLTSLSMVMFLHSRVRIRWLRCVSPIHICVATRMQSESRNIMSTQSVMYVSNTHLNHTDMHSHLPRKLFMGESWYVSDDELSVGTHAGLNQQD